MIKLKSLILELTPHQKKLKTDYLYSQELKNQPRQFPTFDEFYTMYVKLFVGHKLNIPPKEKVLEQYNKLDPKIKNLQSKNCYRVVSLPRRFIPGFSLTNIGIHWSYSFGAAINFLNSGNYSDDAWKKERFDTEWFVFVGKIEEKNIDWLYTISTKLGDDIEVEKEVVFIKNSPIFVYTVGFLENEDAKYVNKWYPINSYKRC